MGLRNSSLTRVQPVFRHLLTRDPTGTSWLGRLLQIAKNNVAYKTTLTEMPHRLLVSYGHEEGAKREPCFEFPVPPPTRFLQWLIKNPDRMVWPTLRGKTKKFGKETQRNREMLFGVHGADVQQSAMQGALQALAKYGAFGSKRAWWAFEGFTCADCLFETESLVLLIECKRTDQLSRSTEWYPARNQLLRNLEAVAELAKEKDFAVLLVVEEGSADPSVSEVVDLSWPHLDQGRRDELYSHYLGAPTWQEICADLDIRIADLPDKTETS